VRLFLPEEPLEYVTAHFTCSPYYHTTCGHFTSLQTCLHNFELGAVVLDGTNVIYKINDERKFYQKIADNYVLYMTVKRRVVKTNIR
jgi:hypothetical protein